MLELILNLKMQKYSQVLISKLYIGRNPRSLILWVLSKNWPLTFRGRNHNVVL